VEPLTSTFKSGCEARTLYFPAQIQRFFEISARHGSSSRILKTKALRDEIAQAQLLSPPNNGKECCKTPFTTYLWIDNIMRKRLQLM
jgi:hypothetical protein